MNWAWKITFLFVSFVLFMSFMVYKSVSQDFHLVSKEYYEDEIAYQERIDAMAIGNEIKDKVHMDIQDKILLITFSESIAEDMNGEIHFYDPVNARKDFLIPIDLDSSLQMAVSFDNKIRKRWKVKIQGLYKSKEVFIEKEIMI